MSINDNDECYQKPSTEAQFGAGAPEFNTVRSRAQQPDDSLGQLVNDLKSLACELDETIRRIDKLSGEPRWAFNIPIGVVHPTLVAHMDNAKEFLQHALDGAKLQVQYDEMRWAAWLAAERKHLYGQLTTDAPVVTHNGR